MCAMKNSIMEQNENSARNYEAVELRIVYFTEEDVFMELSTEVGGEFPDDWQ